MRTLDPQASVLGLRAFVLRSWMRLVALRDRAVLRWLSWLHPGLEIDPSASTALAVASYRIAPGGRLRIGPRVAADRHPRALHFFVEAGAEVEVGADTWLRTEVGPIHLVAFEGARLEIGPDGLLNGCHLSAKTRVTLGRRAWVGPGSRVFDADQHDLDDQHKEERAPVHIGDHAWVASDVTILKGVTIGAHAVVGARSFVTSDIPEHTLAFGTPARPRGRVGDRTHSA